MGHNRIMRFIETPIFTKELRKSLRDEEYRSLQLALILRPEQGDIIPGSGGLRKIRWGAKGKGKRGGCRIIFYWGKKHGSVLYAICILKKYARRFNSGAIKNT